MSVDSARKSNVNVLKIRIFPRTADLISPFMTVVKDRIFFSFIHHYKTVLRITYSVTLSLYYSVTLSEHVI